ncbi:Blue-light photoreceptor [Polystyrenella longa]|uniref:Blue-light photoreceptor n=1 Tax=Polystyrenella longa TaxID=2528007 RepID=A0A518CHS9_9PLAN|nr:PP2C family protein-serine/threonine phosphatase [Polystyrenella longa]QDU78777.1 Blue-light photoreceptor [Polystyrenella longa]
MIPPKHPSPTNSHTASEMNYPQELRLNHRAMESTGEGITIADARLPDIPIIYANKAFYQLTGYSAEDVIDHNCRFLQGSETNPATVEQIREAIKNSREVTVEILNYRKDGTTFWNRLRITPILDADNRVTHFVGVQFDITRRVEAEKKLQAANLQLRSMNQRMKQELEAASRAQFSHLPPDEIEVPGLNIAWTFRPCNELAGDNFNVFKIDDRHVAIYMLDVVGHGVCAALEAVSLSRLLTPFNGESEVLFEKQDPESDQTIVPPAEVLTNLNRRFFAEEARGQFYTILYGIIDLEANEFRYSSAGHPRPILIRDNGETELLESAGFVVGYVEEAEFEEHVVRYSCGDRLYLLTDGVLEAGVPHKEEFGIDRLSRILEGERQRDLTTSLDTLMNELYEWCIETEFADDVSVIALEKKQRYPE